MTTILSNIQECTVTHMMIFVNINKINIRLKPGSFFSFVIMFKIHRGCIILSTDCIKFMQGIVHSAFSQHCAFLKDMDLSLYCYSCCTCVKVTLFCLKKMYFLYTPSTVATIFKSFPKYLRIYSLYLAANVC